MSIIAVEVLRVNNEKNNRSSEASTDVSKKETAKYGFIYGSPEYRESLKKAKKEIPPTELDMWNDLYRLNVQMCNFIDILSDAIGGIMDLVVLATESEEKSDVHVYINEKIRSINIEMDEIASWMTEFELFKKNYHKFFDTSMLINTIGYTINSLSIVSRRPAECDGIHPLVDRSFTDVNCSILCMLNDTPSLQNTEEYKLLEDLQKYVLEPLVYFSRSYTK